MDFEFEKNKKHCPIVDVDGVIASGKQFDLDITLPHDNRDVIYGIVKNCFKEPVCDAVVKLVEVERKLGKDELKPISHTFTDKNGEFVFGPLCPGKEYSIQVWVDDVKHVKICSKCFHEGKCLKGVKLDKCEHDFSCKDFDEKDCKDEHKDECKNKGDKYFEDECHCKKDDKKDIL